MSDDLLKATGSCRTRALVESRLDITAGNTGDTSANFYWKEKVGKFFRKVRSKVCKCIEMNRLIENFIEKKEDFGRFLAKNRSRDNTDLLPRSLREALKWVIISFWR